MKQIYIVVGNILVGFLTYIYQILSAGVLGPVNFGLMASMMAIVSVFGLASSGLAPVAAVQLVSQPSVTTGENRSSDILLKSSLRIGNVILPFAIVLIIFFGDKTNFGRLPLLMTFIYLYIAIAYAIFIGRLQALNMIVFITTVGIIASLLRVLSLIPIKLLSLGVTSAIFLVLVISILTLYSVYIYFHKRVLILDSKPLDKVSLKKILAYFLFWIFVYSDVIFMKLFFDDDVSGLYAFGSTIGKTLLIVTLINIQYKYASLLHFKYNSFSLKNLISIFRYVFILGVISIILAINFGNLFLVSFYEDIYNGSYNYIIINTLFSMVISLNLILLNLLLLTKAQNLNKSFLTILTIFIILIYVTPLNPSSILIIYGLSNIILTSVLLMQIYKYKKQS